VARRRRSWLGLIDEDVRSGWGVTNGIRADPCNFMGACGSVEKYMIAYRSGM
jgi:hypothetical protein